MLSQKTTQVISPPNQRDEGHLRNGRLANNRTQSRTAALQTGFVLYVILSSDYVLNLIVQSRKSNLSIADSKPR